jgi:hypothetical protein
MKNLVVVLPLVILVGFLLVAIPSPASEENEDSLLKPVNLTVNSRADEEDPHLSSDRLKLYFARLDKGKWEIMVAQRRSTRSNWSTPRVLGAYVQTPAHDRGLSLTLEQRYPQYLYYATTRDREAGNYDIYVAVNQGLRSGTFTSPTSVDEVNTKEDERDPWLTGDGQHLFFSRKTDDGWRVFVVSRPRRQVSSSRGFGEAKLLRELPPGFHHATLTPDNRTMFLQGPLGKGMTGIFRSVYSSATGWSKPEPVKGLNHPDALTGDYAPCLSRDGQLLYFASDRPGGKGGSDLWGIPVRLLE